MSYTPSTEPHYWVKDLTAALKYYQEALGFTIVDSWPAEEPTWVYLELASHRIQLSAPPALQKGSDMEMNQLFEQVRQRLGQPGACTVALPIPDVDSHYQRAKEQGAKILTSLRDRWWGWCEYTVEDPDGNWLVFYRPL